MRSPGGVAGGRAAHLQHGVVRQQLAAQRGHVAVEAAVVHLLHGLADAAGGWGWGGLQSLATTTFTPR
jgi:hypothetical protein